MAQIRYSTSDSWHSLPGITTSDFFNGIDAARFDYPNRTAYISAAFLGDEDIIYVRILNGQDEVTISSPHYGGLL